MITAKEWNWSEYPMMRTNDLAAHIEDIYP